MRKLVMILSAALFLQAHAQEGWTVWQCMDYAVENNHDVRIASLSLDNSKADRLRAVGDFLPSIGAGIGGQFNFGRAIDPQTNAYTDVSTFNNSYSVSASLPLFDGFARVHALNAARADLLKGKNRLLQQRGQTALATFQAFVNVLYYKGTVLLAEKKLAESGAVLEQTRVLEEIGRKSRADVAQVESQYATDDYSLTQQRNALALAVLALKTAMNYPLADTLLIDERSADLFHVAEAGGCLIFRLMLWLIILRFSRVITLWFRRVIICVCHAPRFFRPCRSVPASALTIIRCFTWTMRSLLANSSGTIGASTSVCR